ncbi:MAG: hypothetical protein JF606_15805 [Burkholderiales bacterium]|nr:hypothetical protein [Burkholderiales bacterium]
MKPHRLLLEVALMLAGLPLAATAQSSASSPASAASASPAVKPGPRQATPAELREQASPPGELRPANPVTPQISIPLRRTEPIPLKPPPRVVRRSNAASSTSGVDDSATRCEAEASDQARRACRDKRAREAGGRTK